MLTRALPVWFLLLPVFSGCLTPLAPAGTDPVEEILSALRWTPEDRLEVEVRVPVVLLGFEPGMAALVQSRLSEPTPIDHLFLDSKVQVPPDLTDPSRGRSGLPMPIVPIARWEVSEATPAEAGAFWAEVAAAPAADGIFDGNRAEAWLAERYSLDPASPTLFLLHAGGRVGEHAWRYTFQNGYLEPIRVFGERLPYLAMDLSAREDPAVTTRSNAPTLPLRTPVYVPFDPVAAYLATGRVPVQRAAYNYPLESSGQAVADGVAQAAADATHFRLLQSTLYPVATKPCHAVTLILAVRGTSYSEIAAGPAEQYVDVPGLESAFNNLTGAGRTVVDFRLIRLPHEDPVLDAVIPRHEEGLSAFRLWMDQNWDTYWVPHEGCEPYVSLVVSGDFPETLGFSGIAMNTVTGSHRISFSVVSDHHRLRETWEGPVSEQINNKDAGIRFDRFNRLYSHETGHLMGQRHPHDVRHADGGTGFSPAFSSVWSAMSYEIRWRTNDFGAIDINNHARNRAGFVLAAAVHQGLGETPEFAQALDLIARREWRAAGDLLIPKLETGHDQECRYEASC